MTRPDHPIPSTEDGSLLVDQQDKPVLVVDLDGTLLRSDMLHESFWIAVADNVRVLNGSLRAIGQGRAGLKAYLADQVEIDPATLPYDPRVIKKIADWREQGGRTALVTATNEILARQIADFLGLFDEVHGSTDRLNLKGQNKADFLVERYGAKGFVYIGDSTADLPVWEVAAHAVSVGAKPRVQSALDVRHPEALHLPPLGSRPRDLLRTLRPHQWLKNLLVFVPMLADLSFSWPAVLAATFAFVALSLTASAGYVLNDLLDLADDRSHPRKRHRAFAAGDLPASTGTVLVPALLIIGLLIALVTSPLLAAVVLIYFVATTAYSIKLKRHTMVDICMLATLFTLRIIAGGVAIDGPLSVWLLAFSMFMFFSLAAVKRLAELTDNEAAGRATSRRGYQVEDRSVLSQMAVTAGYLSVLVLALYIDQPVVQEKFGAPVLLWGVCPLIIFWISRMVLLASRGEMHDDPLVFALENRTSRKVILWVSLTIFLAVIL